jgi:hypothetical protein
MKTLSRLLMLGALATAFALPAFAQDPAASPAALCDEAAKGELYTTYYNLKKTDQQKAFETATQYLDKYGSCSDNYTASVKKFADAYKKATLRIDFFKAYDAKDTAKLTSLGNQLLAADPNDAAVAMLMALGVYTNMGSSPSASVQSDAANLIAKALALIEAGQEPKNLENKVSWLAFNNRDDAVGYLNLASAQLLSAQMNYAESAKRLLSVAQSSSKSKESPDLYRLLAFAYSKEREPMAEQYKTITKNFTVETPESQLLLLNINQVVDREIDAYARAVAYQTDAAKKAELMSVLTDLYKSRHDGKPDGLNELIAGIKAQPLLMTQPLTSLPAAAPTPTPADGAAPTAPVTTGQTTPAGTTVAAPAATAPKPAPTTPATTTKPATTTTATNPPAKKKP